MRALLSALVVMALGISIGCSTALKDEARPADATSPRISSDYAKVIELYSAGDTEYSGFYNNFEFKATILNSVVRDVQASKRAEYYQWDAAKASTEREKSLQEMNSNTKVFFAFFTPDRINDNLDDVKSIWKVYLDSGGQRYEGRLKKLRLLLVELQVLYPYHTRWTTPYEVTFDVPTAAIEGQDSTFTVTGPLGTRDVKLRALQR